MTDFLFSLTFVLAAPFWALMIFFPRWRWTERIIGSPLIVVPPMVIYLIVLIPIIGEVLAAVSSPQLPVLQGVLSTPAGTAAVWAHLIAFDLFVGRWMYRDAGTRGINPWLMGPLLLVTIMLAPVALLAYFVVRSVTAALAAPRTASSGLDLPVAHHPLPD